MTKTAVEIKNRINEFVTAFTFDYHGRHCGVDPYNEHEFAVWFGNEVDIVAHSIDEVMGLPVFDGKSLTDIVAEIDIDSF